MNRRGVVLSLLLVCTSTPALARRAAVVVGENEGASGEPSLAYAEDDAVRVADALVAVGGFSASDVRTLRSPAAGDVRAALLAENEAFRAEAGAGGSGGADSMLVVYYSGHADADALHLGHESLSLREVYGFVKSSPARFRLLIVDACRSGALVTTKGGSSVAPLPRAALGGVAEGGEGIAVLTAAAAGEDAQESSSVGGSFFTHHFVSALLGAADVDRDGAVTIAEAFSYARDETVRDSSATLAGTQHPSYRYDFSGSGAVVLSVLRDRSSLGQLVVPAGRDAVVLQHRDGGRLIAEARAAGASRALRLRGGRYFVRVRDVDALFEGDVDVGVGRPTVLDLDALERTDYARLVRKGGARSASVAPFVTATTRTPLTGGLPDATPCSGAGAGAFVAVGAFVVAPRLSACGESFANDALTATTTEIGATLGLRYAWSLPAGFSVSVGPDVGVGFLHQTFSSPFAADNDLAGPVFGVTVAAEWQGPWGIAPFVDVGARTGIWPVEQEQGAVAVAALTGFSASVGVARYF